ncbi:alginate lyase family protein [Streptomyces paludis]|uniref:Tat pathway signal sequence domain protein n=1 Tax=Streptomyces paludis TaxID=2282738 RepID=A0A345I154_9ACTN|nr:alginate lyase family protein [Streptomyces paludis]AXG82678.1 Tat pathway signal sequence domain protein [Streptomyces paludis]
MGVVGAGTGALGGAVTPAAAAPVAPAAPAFAHPGLLHTQADFDRMAAKVKAGAEPYLAGFNKLVRNGRAQSSWRARPLERVVRGGEGDNVAQFYLDVHAAYQNALRWKVTGDTAHADTARDILNTWSASLTTLDGNADRFLAAGIHGYQFANAAEIMRGYEGFDLARFQKMMLTVFYPMNDSFLTHHNDAFITNYWPNWDLVSIASVLAIGILCDDRAKVDQAVTYFKSGEGNGSLKNAISVIHPGGLGQWIEAGRDQGHALLGIGLAATICEMAWNQGIDLYGHDDNRFLKGAEYVAKWNLGESVPFSPYTWRKGAPGKWSGTETFTAASGAGRGQVRPIWEGIHNHYVKRRGLAAPYVTAINAQVRPEGGGGDYGFGGGGFDHLGFGTLAFTRDAAPAAAPAASGSTGTGAVSGVDSGSGAGSGSGSGSGTGTGAAPTPAETPTPTESSTPSSTASPQSGIGEDLAATGASGIATALITAGAALTGGFLLISRRRAGRGA